MVRGEKLLQQIAEGDQFIAVFCVHTLTIVCCKFMKAFDGGDFYYHVD